MMDETLHQQLVSTYWKRLFVYLIQSSEFGNDFQTVEDGLQEGFLNVLRWGRFRPEKAKYGKDPWWSYLRRTMINACRKVQKRKPKWVFFDDMSGVRQHDGVHRQQKDPNLPEPTDPTYAARMARMFRDPESEADVAIINEKWPECFQLLTPRQQDVLRMLHVENLEPGEVARELRCGKSNVSNLETRAWEALAKCVHEKQTA